MTDIFISSREQIIVSPDELKKKTLNKISGKGFLDKLNHKRFNDLPNTMYSLRVTTGSLSNSSLKDVADDFHYLLNLLAKAC